jgi:hypothetical protein
MAVWPSRANRSPGLVRRCSMMPLVACPLVVWSLVVWSLVVTLAM